MTRKERQIWIALDTLADKVEEITRIAEDDKAEAVTCYEAKAITSLTDAILNINMQTVESRNKAIKETLTYITNILKEEQ